MTSQIDAWLAFVSTSVWQIVVIVSILLFRREFRDLLRRTAHFKHGDTEVSFEQLSGKGLDPSPLATEALRVRDEQGFFTNFGVQELVRQSKYLDPAEQIREAVPVFRTPNQQTWILSTNRQVFFVLDDDGTRASQRLIQARVPLESTLPVHTEDLSGEVGAFRMGESGTWYYSLQLLGDPTKARQRLEEFLRTASS